MVSKLFKKLVNNGIVGHPEKCGLFLISSMVLGLLNQLQIFSQLYLIELLGLFNRSGATRAMALGISKTFDRVWYIGLLHKLKSYGISGHMFGLISYFLLNR